MVDITEETVIPINQAPVHYPGRPNISTVYRHFTRGCRGCQARNVCRRWSTFHEHRGDQEIHCSDHRQLSRRYYSCP